MEQDPVQDMTEVREHQHDTEIEPEKMSSLDSKEEVEVLSMKKRSG